MNRKEFIYTSGIWLSASLLGCLSSKNKSKTDKKTAVYFDLHTHPGVFFMRGTDMYPGDEAFLHRVSEMKSSGLTGAFFSLVADAPLLQRTDTGIVPKGAFKDDEGWKVFQHQLAILKDLLSRSEAEIALKAGELENGGKVKAYIACEGGDFLGGNTGYVEEAYEAGVRSIQLVHYVPNELGDLQTWQAQHNGLSRFGKEVVKKMNELGMVIDVAHASEQTVRDVAANTTAPVILSHSILKAGENRPIGARAISPEHAKLVAGTGGVIGMWPSGFSASFDEFVDHTLRMIDTVGIDHVGMGTDMDSNFKPVIEDYAGFNHWKETLAAKGLTVEEVGKLAGGNARRVLDAIL